MYSSRCATRTIFSNWSQCMRATGCPMASNASDVPPGAAELSVMRPSDVWSRLATTSTASWLNWCQCWSRDRRRVASSCGCVSAGINCGANVRRTSATGEEVEGTPDVIARLVAFKFSFADGVIPSRPPCLKQVPLSTLHEATCSLQ